MDAHVKLFLLGPFRAERDGEALTDFKSNKVRALLAYLAVERQKAHHRDVLADILWPESSDTSALALLRDALSNMRLLLGDRDAESPCIRIVEDTLQFYRHEDVWLDVAEFTALNRANIEANAPERAVALYRGDFLEGFTLRNNLDFESWLLRQRESYRRAVQQMLYQLTTSHLQGDDYAAAQTTARRQLQLDPYIEETHRQLLRALALDGQRNQALAHYHEYCALLDEELNVKPDIRTMALYQRIRDHRLTSSGAVHQAVPGYKGSEDLSFVARETELARLEKAMRKAQRGQGQMLLITGEAGSGKTRLIEAFTRRYVADAPGTVAAWGAANAQVSDGDPYLPFREMLRILTGDFDVSTLRASLTPALAQQLEELSPIATRALQRFGPDLLGGLLPTDRELVSSPDSSSARTPPLPAALCDQIERVFSAIARHGTLVLILDDLHWADSSTLNILTHLGRRLHDNRILLIGSYRSADAQPRLIEAFRELLRRWGDITIDLDRIAGREFVSALLNSRPNTLGAAFREQLYRQTNGHALFTVALIQQLEDEGILIRNTDGIWTSREGLDWHYLPPRVEAVIAARMTRLPEDLQKMLTVASVEGETFTADVIANVLNLHLDTVQDALSGPLQGRQLIEAYGLERTGHHRVARYQFRHMLFQQYLYSQLDPVQRARYHEDVGRALESLYAEQVDTSAKLAYHFEAAGLLKKAVTYLTRAGAYVYRLSAPTEAINLYRRGLALLRQMPESSSRDRQELDVLMGLETPLFSVKGWGSPERAETLNRAYKLARRLKETNHLQAILRALSDVNTARAKHIEALTYAEQLLMLGQKTDEPISETLGHRTTGVSHFFLGHYQKARECLESGISCYEALVSSRCDPSQIPDIEEMMFLWAWLPSILFALGYPDQAVKSSYQALDRVQPDSHVHAKAKMLTVAGATFHTMTSDPKAVIRYADKIKALADEYQLPAFQGWAMFYRGWGRAALGNTKEGLPEMAAGRDQLQATGTEASLIHLLTLQAESYKNVGNIIRSADILAKALSLAERTGAHSYLAEIYRLHGELVMTEAVEAEGWFRKAIDVAQKQQAKLWELRATVSLARLWQYQGHSRDAYQKLSDLYEWFDEGFDLPDLITAKSLLNMLTEQS